MKLNRVLLFLLITLFAPNGSFAGIIVSIDNIALTAGGASGFMNVNLSWVPTGIEPATTTIDFFASEFQIAAVGPAGSVVHFRKYFDPVVMFNHNGDLEQADGNYLFAGNSLNIDQLQHSGSVGGVNDATFNGSDGRFDFDPMNSPANDIILDATPRLLNRFEVYATGMAVGTELFQLSLQPSPSSMFFDNDGNELDFSIPGGLNGQISVTGGAAAVPEPATTGALAVLFSSFALARFRRRKIKRQGP